MKAECVKCGLQADVSLREVTFPKRFGLLCPVMNENTVRSAADLECPLLDRAILSVRERMKKGRSP